MKKQISVRNVKIGGGAPVAVQSMLNVRTEDVEACLSQIERLGAAGCDIVRLAVPTMEAAAAFGEIRKRTDMPLVADIHFDYRLAVATVENGADKIRINPGNIGDDDRVRAVVTACLSHQIPIRVGVNSGSLEKDLLSLYGPTARALAESTLRNVRRLEDMGFTDIAVSLKSSDVPTTIEAYRIVDKACDYPLHIGVTEAGTRESGIIKSAVGLGTLLMDGIGDTMRVSLTGDPVKEVSAARKILAACGLEKEPINIVSCPTCGRTKVDLEKIVLEVEQSLAPIARKRQEEGKKPLTVAVMGCEVNGPGEAAEADLGVAGGSGKGLLFRKGEKLRVVDESEITSALIELVKHYEDI